MCVEYHFRYEGCGCLEIGNRVHFVYPGEPQDNSQCVSLRIRIISRNTKCEFPRLETLSIPTPEYRVPLLKATKSQPRYVSALDSSLAF